VVLIQRAAAVGLACLLGATTASTTTSVEHPRREVLPDSVTPRHYELALAPDAESLTFTGKVAITIDVIAAGPTITLNAVGLTFDHASVDGGSEARVSLDKELGRATLTFAGAIAPGQHLLNIEYHGAIGRATQGFFAMDYAGPDGPRRTLATNFEPADARDLLPCWDEPARKATFTVSIDVPNNRMAISNMPIAQVTALSSATQRVRFQQSPKMSTYLLFVGVGDFERIQTRIDGVDVGVVVKRGDTGKAAYALDQAGTLLHYYNDYFGIPYPLPKLDLIAAPGEIVGGSMENWGAIFYSQNHLLFDPRTSTEQDRQLVFLVVSHEMAHQWFGDLVTMAWWDDLWLNEGFARWMQSYAADDLHPEWETGLQAAAIFEEGKQADSVPSTHPVVQEVDTAEQAQQAFDSITYDKGAAIITMINGYVGRERFRGGVRRYMRAHAYGNTVDTDLWGPMQDVAGLPILGIERDFTRQEGLPLVTVSRTSKGASLVQTRFADDPSTLAAIPPQKWRLPLAVGPLDGAKRHALLQGSAGLTQAPPLLVNAGQLGYARVLYRAEMYDALKPRLGTLPAVDQLGLFNDAWALTVAGDAPAAYLMDLPALLPADANPVVWNRVLDIFEQIDRHYSDGPQRQAYRRFVLRLLAPLAARLGPRGSANEASNVEILRGRLLQTQGRLGDAAVLASARQRLDAGTGTAAEQRTAVNIVAARADATTFEELLSRARRTDDPLQKAHLFRALAGVADPALARRMIDIALSDQVPAGSNEGLLLELASRHPDTTWEVLAPRLDDPQLPFSKSQRWEIAGYVAGYSAEPQRIAELEAYERRSVPPEARKPFLESVAAIHRNRRIVKKILPEIGRWIASQGSAVAIRVDAPETRGHVDRSRLSHKPASELVSMALTLP
jgi:aminopeptidase N